MNRLIVVIALLLITLPVAAQVTTLQVVTKTIRKTIPWQPGWTVELNGEKADIEVEATSDKNITIEAELSARHPSLDSARHDLDAWKFVADQIRKKVFIRAYVSLGQSGKPNANLRAKIKVRIPASCPVSITNRFGKARIQSMASNVYLNGSFCSFTVSDLQGRLKIESEYGNIEGVKLLGQVEINAKRADVSLSDLQSDCTVKSEHGAVNVAAGSRTGNLNITALKADVTLNVESNLRHNMVLTTENGAINTPKTLPMVTQQTYHSSQAVYTPQNESNRKLEIHTNSGNILVK